MKEINIETFKDLIGVEWEFENCKLKIQPQTHYKSLLVMQTNSLFSNGEVGSRPISVVSFLRDIQDLEKFGLKVIVRNKLSENIASTLYSRWGISHFKIIDKNTVEVANNELPEGYTHISFLHYDQGIKGVKITPLNSKETPYFPTKLYEYLETEWKANGKSFFRFKGLLDHG